MIRQVKATNKLTPKKMISVPKLELNAAQLGPRVTQATQALPSHVCRRRYLTESSTVRNGIRKEASDYQVIVSSVSESCRRSRKQTSGDPADFATRSTLDGEFFQDIWWSDPDFLLRPDKDWPADLPWMKANDEIRPVRVLSAAQTTKTDWSKVQITESDVPQLC